MSVMNVFEILILCHVCASNLGLRTCAGLTCLPLSPPSTFLSYLGAEPALMGTSFWSSVLTTWVWIKFGWEAEFGFGVTQTFQGGPCWLRVDYMVLWLTLRVCISMCYITRSQSVYGNFVSKPFYVCLFFLDFSKWVVHYVMLSFYLLVTESFHVHSAIMCLYFSIVKCRIDLYQIHLTQWTTPNITTLK
jgi:hypothetical protein